MSLIGPFPLLVHHDLSVIERRGSSTGNPAHGQKLCHDVLPGEGSSGVDDDG